MAEVSAFIYGWAAGIFAVIIWILYGIDTLLQLMRFVNDAFSHLPGLSRLAYTRKEKGTAGGKGGRDGESDRGGVAKFNVLAAEEGLEGLTGSTKRVTPITAGGLCMMSWYGPDGTTGPPIECRLSLENNEVTIYQLLRVGDTNVGTAGGVGGNSPGGARGSKTQATLAGSTGKRGNKDADTSAFRSAAGVTVAEHRKGRVSVLHTTVMELRHFNKPNKGAGGEQGNGGEKKASANRSAAAANNGSEAGSVAASQRGSKNGADGDGNTAASGTPRGSKQKPREGGSAREDPPANNNSNINSNNNTSGAAAVEGVTRPGVDPLFNGRVLIWRTMDGCALFDSVHVPHQPPNATFGSSMRRGGSTGSMSQAGTANSFSKSPSADSLNEERSMNSSVDDGDGTEDGDLTSTGWEGSMEGRPGSDTKVHNSNSKHHRHHNGRRHSKANREMHDMANWSCVIIKFERARESERWHTLLSGLKEARAWSDFAKTLPNPDTVNTFLSRFFFQNMRVNGLADVIIKQIRKKLRELPAKKFPRDLGGQLILDEFLIGTQIPWITDVSEPTVSANGEVGFDFNLMYKGGEGGFTLFFRLALEFLGIRVPHAVFSVKLIELEATVHISIGPPPSKKFWIGGHKPPVLRLEVHQGCASGKGILHRVLTSLPDLSGIMTNLIKLYLFSDLVLPYMDDFPLPSVVKSPKGSMHDMRVRTFDRQRAAKISGAPVRSSSAPTSKPPPTPKTDAALSNEAKGTKGESAAESLSANASMSNADTCRRSTATGAVGPTGGGVGGAPAQSFSQSPAPPTPTPSTPPPASAERKKKTSVPSTPRGGPAEASNRSREFASNPSFDATGVQNVASPIMIPSSTNRSAPSFRGSGDVPNGSSGNLQNSSTLNANKTMTSSVLNRTFQSETDLTESEEVLSSTKKMHAGSSSTMRSLKNLLKVKSKDMTRESVSRSKDKHKE